MNPGELFTQVKEGMPGGRVMPGILVQHPAHFGPESIVGIRAPAKLKALHVEERIEGDLPLRYLDKRFDPGDHPGKGDRLSPEPGNIPAEHIHQYTLCFVIKIKSKGEFRQSTLSRDLVDKMTPENPAVRAGLPLTGPLQDPVKGEPEFFLKRRGDAVDPHAEGKFPGSIREAVTPDPFIYRDGDEIHITPGREDLFEKIKQRTAVFAPAYRHPDTISRKYPPVSSYCPFCFGLHILDEMALAEMESGITLEYNGRPPAFGAPHIGYQINLYHQDR
jgi:hypothetical protein